MNVSRAWFVSAAIVLGLAFLTTEGTVNAATPRPVSVAHPSGGEVFIIGSQLQIRLNRRPNYPKVRIELSRDGGNTFELLGTVDNTVRPASLRRKLDWTVTGPASDNCVLRVTGIRRGVDIISSLDQPFTIGTLDVSGSPADHGGLLGLLDDDHPQYLRTDGTRALTGNQSAGGNKITNVAAPTANADAATKQYVDNANTAQDTAQAATDGAQDTAIAAKVAKAGGTMTGPLTVTGLIETSGGAGGVKFPDGTVQTTAAPASTGAKILGFGVGDANPIPSLSNTYVASEATASFTIGAATTVLVEFGAECVANPNSLIYVSVSIDGATPLDTNAAIFRTASGGGQDGGSANRMLLLNLASGAHSITVQARHGAGTFGGIVGKEWIKVTKP